MVRARARPSEELQPAAEPVGGSDHVFLKVLKAEQTRAGAGDEQAARPYERDGKLVQVLVLLAPLPVSVFVAREDELGRVEDDAVPRFAVGRHLARIGKGVGMHELDPGLIEVGIAPRLRDRSLVQVDGSDVFGASRNPGRQGKSARVRAKIEDPALRQPAEGGPVLALIAEKSGLVALREIDLEADSVFADLDRPRRRGGCPARKSRGGG